MRPAKKLQVFVSSTYTDLKEERQAAVEAILTAGHIPAGMELFTAGDQSQMDVIRRWIDESDVFLLILGGRYGSLEPHTGKSYIHLEYEYAIERGKPLFAVVVDEAALEDRVKTAGTGAIEIQNAAQLREFRAFVLSRMVRFWRDARDIKLAIHETISEYTRNPDLAGWIPGDQAVSTGILAEEIARLTKENADLRKQIRDGGSAVVHYAGLAFEELYALLKGELVNVTVLDPSLVRDLERVAAEFGDTFASLLHVLWMLRDVFSPTTKMRRNQSLFQHLEALGRFGLIRFEEWDRRDDIWSYQLTDDGRKFLLRLRRQRLGEQGFALAQH